MAIDYLCFTAEEASTIQVREWFDIYAEYSFDMQNWSVFTNDVVISLNANQSVFFRGNSLNAVEGASFAITGAVNISGHLITLYDYSGNNLLANINGYQKFDWVFQDCDIVSARQLIMPDDTVPGCYKDMFYNCTSLVSSPVLISQAASESSYEEMFLDCDSLVDIKVEFDSWSTASDAYYAWVSGVAHNGVFYCSSDLPDIRNISRIPIGWTKQAPISTVNKVVFGERVLIDLTGDDTVESDVTQGKIFHKANGEIAEGTSTAITPSGKKNITDTNETDVSAYATAQVVDADLIASNIKKDVNILGVVGTYEGGGIIPTGTIEITEDGVYDVTEYEYAEVNTSGPAPVEIVSWAEGTDAQILAMIEADRRGDIDIHDYWAVGDTRSVSLSAIASSGTGYSVNESQPAQTIDMVLMDNRCKGFKFIDNTTPKFIVGQKESLSVAGRVNVASTNAGGWKDSDRRAWCNEGYANALPTTFKSVFKSFKWKQGTGSVGGTSQTTGLYETEDLFGLTPAFAVHDSNGNAFQDEKPLYEVWSWYLTAANKIKILSGGSATYWWECSPASGYSNRFCCVNANGKTYSASASGAYGIAPFGCI